MYINEWSPDGKWLLAVTGGQVWLIPFPSLPHAETAAQKIVSNPAYLMYQPHFSPDDRWVVFEAVANSPNPESALYVVPASGGPWTRITDGRHWDTSRAGLPTERPPTSFHGPAASSMSGESASIRLRERPLASRFRYPNSTASA